MFAEESAANSIGLRALRKLPQKQGPLSPHGPARRLRGLTSGLPISEAVDPAPRHVRSSGTAVRFAVSRAARTARHCKCGPRRVEVPPGKVPVNEDPGRDADGTWVRLAS